MVEGKGKRRGQGEVKKGRRRAGEEGREEYGWGRISKAREGKSFQEYTQRKGNHYSLFLIMGKISSRAGEEKVIYP